MNIDIALIPSTRVHLKQITNLNVEHKAIKLLEDNIDENLDDLGL